MKKMKKLLYLFISASLFISCSDDDMAADNSNSGWLDFTTFNEDGDRVLNPSSETGDSVGTKDVEIQVNLGTNLEGQTVTFAVELVFGDADDQTKFGTFTSTIGAGEKSGFLSVPISTTDSGYEALVTIISSDQEYSAGLSDDSKLIEHTIAVCPDLKENLLDVGVGASLYNGEILEFGYDLQLTQTGDNTFYSENIWGNFVPNFGGPNFQYPGTLTINSDLTVDFVSDPDNPNFLSQNAAGGSGFYDACSDIIFIDIESDFFGSTITVAILAL
jgi:hypothetical protein